MPCTGCCFSHYCMLSVIMSEGAGGVAPPEFIKWVDYSENRTWTSPWELYSRCSCDKTCHPNRIFVSPDARICPSLLYTAIPMRYHTVSRRHRSEVAKYARWQNGRRPSGRHSSSAATSRVTASTCAPTTTACGESAISRVRGTPAWHAGACACANWSLTSPTNWA